MRLPSFVRVLFVSCLAPLPWAEALAQPVICGLRAACEARGSIGTVGSTPYDDIQNSGWVLGPFAGPVSVTASGNRGAAGCSASSTVQVAVQHGYATISGAGAATNCFTGSAVMYTNAPDGAQASDRLNISSATLPVGTRVPIRLRIDLRGGAASSQSPFPFFEVRARIYSAGTWGPFTLHALTPGIFEGTTDVGTVGSFLDILAVLSAYAGAGSDSLQRPGEPSFTATCSINVGARFTVESLDARATLAACSGHNYGIGLCVADFDDGSGTGMPDGGVTIEDLLFYLTLFDQGVPAADVDDGTGTGTPDGGVTIDDLLYYLARFDAGC